ncbi:heat-shock protein [Alteromonas sp. 5E99-2]|uniref:RNA-binding S4 domain-containing protein n=1 Tax=Alteromonas sp. 5E99-2 TaxID=2817683 RepID=UPI001A99AF48|nr:S4 domain-containing protein [Alteromonas sp. 5E99-2]MBO1256825.1 heat-shock protein [Alteromonas sp. 5E99-2]
MNKDPTNTQEVPVRLDKWIWAARLCKTRSLAREWIQAGKVHYNGHRTKPGKNVEPGAMVKIPAGWDTKEIKILYIVDKRQSAPIAQTLYEETLASIEKREQNKAARQVQAFHNPKPEHRPDKKQRREIIKLKHQ